MLCCPGEDQIWLSINIFYVTNILSSFILQIASRLETQAACNIGRNKGYVPVFQTFTSTISSMDLSRIELVTLRNQTFRELNTVRVSLIPYDRIQACIEY